MRYSVDRDLSDGWRYPPLEEPGPDLLFDFSHVLEYAKIRTVLQSTLGAFRTENQYDGENGLLYLGIKWSLLRPRTDLSSLGISGVY